MSRCALNKEEFSCGEERIAKRIGGRDGVDLGKEKGKG